jgi:C4-dicarboxylate-specific signal transduction histidine kinase
MERAGRKSQGPASEGRDRADHTILIVDDDRGTRSMLAELLASQGYRVIAASDAHEALNLLGVESIDLVVCDVMMPSVDGIELCARLRRKLNRPELPVIFVTGLDDRETRLRAKEAGADEFLVKPIDGLELFVRAERLLKLREYREVTQRRAERLEIELSEASQKLIRMERFKALGSLASGVGHELANLTMMSELSLESLRKCARMGRPVEEADLNRLDVLSQLLGQHADKLLRIGREGTDDEELLSLGDVVRDSLDLMRDGQMGSTEITLDTTLGSTSVRMNRTLLEHVIFNLLRNARDAVSQREDAGAVRVSVESCDTFQRVRLMVNDNGIGIAERHLSQVFEPYFTTKPPSRGMGIGLTLVRQIVESVGGRVVLVSREGVGTTASVDFPHVESNEATQP